MIQPQSISYRQDGSEGAEPKPARQVGPGVGLALSLVVFAALWKLIVEIRHYPTFVLPAPDVVLLRLISEFSNGTLPHHAALTLVEAVGGFGLALVVSFVLGYLLAHAPRVERILAPQLAATQAVPIVAVAPLIILWIGANLQSKVLIAALVTFFPILSSTIVALRAVPRELIDMARISGANRWQMLRYVELPLSLPGIFAGVKSGLALATTGAVVGEFVGGRDGLGALINISRGLFDTPLMFAALVTLAAMTLSFYLIVTLLERMLVRWEW